MSDLVLADDELILLFFRLGALLIVLVILVEIKLRAGNKVSVAFRDLETEESCRYGRIKLCVVP